MDVLDEIATDPRSHPLWRAPTEGEHVCVGRGCGGAANLGFMSGWYCARCVPADFFPHNRRPPA